jgi:hypothetical protein
MTNSRGGRDHGLRVQHHLVILSASDEGAQRISTYNSDYRVPVTDSEAKLLPDI